MYGDAPNWRFQGPCRTAVLALGVFMGTGHAPGHPILAFDDGRSFSRPLVEKQHLVEADSLPNGMLVQPAGVDPAEQRDEKKRTIKIRCERAAELATHDRPAIVWCQFNEKPICSSASFRCEAGFRIAVR